MSEQHAGNHHHQHYHATPPQSSGSQVTQNMQKKYTILGEIKILQDRLQDMYTNRSDMVNVTGDGWAAAHQNEIKEIRWVYLKALWPLNVHISLFSVALGELLSIFTGVLFEVGAFAPASFFALITVVTIIFPLGYLLYAEMLTEECGKWSIGQNTTMFHDKMKQEMAIIASSAWAFAVGVFFITLFLFGSLDSYILQWTVAGLKEFKIIIPDHLKAPMLDNGVIYGLELFIATVTIFYFYRAKTLTKIRLEAGEIASKNKKSQELLKNKDSFDEARSLYKKYQK